MTPTKTTILLALVDSADVDSCVRFLVHDNETMSTKAHAQECALDDADAGCHAQA